MTAAAAPAASDPAGTAPAAAPRLLVLALAVTVLLTVAWTLKDWTALSRLRLPDNDDMARLAQIRDWIGGQAFNDLAQHRLGPPGGASMHWSRIADAGPALLVLLLEPLVGRHAAEIGMAIVWPALLFLAYLLLVARIAVQLGGARAGVPALLLAALAFPTISLFLPGRIDHHALQILLCLVLVWAILPSERGAFGRGLAAGSVAALSLAVGLEAAPEIVAAMVALGVAWLIGGRDEDARALGFAAALGGVTLGLLAFARPWDWPEQWCDGFTPASSRATLVLAAAWLTLALAGRRLNGWKRRSALAVPLGALVAAAAWQTSQTCVLGPYGALDPFLQHVWMRNVSEARGLFSGDETIGTGIAYGGVMLVGAALAAVRVADPRWRSFAIFLVLSALAALPAIRVTYIMAGIAVIPFAAMLARDAPIARRLALWVFGAGISWNLLATQLDAAFARPMVEAKAAQKHCTDADAIREVAALPPGTVAAPLDLGAYLLGMTPHHVLGAVYHRNNAGNLAVYRFFLAPPDRAREQARAHGYDYVALCADSLHEDGIAPLRAGSLVAHLQDGGRPPPWLEPIPTRGAIRLYRVR